MRVTDIKLGMKEAELRAALGAPYRVQLAGASMVYRWQEGIGEDADEWVHVRLRRVRGEALGLAVVDKVEGRCDGMPIALP